MHSCIKIKKSFYSLLCSPTFLNTYLNPQSIKSYAQLHPCSPLYLQGLRQQSQPLVPVGVSQILWAKNRGWDWAMLCVSIDIHSPHQHRARTSAPIASGMYRALPPNCPKQSFPSTHREEQLRFALLGEWRVQAATTRLMWLDTLPAPTSHRDVQGRAGSVRAAGRTALL